MDGTIESIKSFWDERAERFGEAWNATLGERWLRMQEIKTIMRHIRRRKPKRMLDVGCGNGFSTKRYAAKFPQTEFTGMDYSERMISYAKNAPLHNCGFVVGDVLEPDSFPERQFDIITTQRCLQNLPDYERQSRAIENLLTKKTSDGVLLLMECSRDGVAQLNNLRAKLGMKPIDNIMPWHNNFFADRKIIDDFNATIEYFSSTYMFFTRVLRLPQKLWRIAHLLPAVGQFGYDRLYIVR